MHYPPMRAGVGGQEQAAGATSDKAEVNSSETPEGEQSTRWEATASLAVELTHIDDARKECLCPNSPEWWGTDYGHRSAWAKSDEVWNNAYSQGREDGSLQLKPGKDPNEASSWRAVSRQGVGKAMPSLAATANGTTKQDQRKRGLRAVAQLVSVFCATLLRWFMGCGQEPSPSPRRRWTETISTQ